MPTKSTTCCFTGYRPEKIPFHVSEYGYTYRQLQLRLERAVQEAILIGYRHFITGMSRGVDLWAAERVIAFRDAFTPLMWAGTGLAFLAVVISQRSAAE